MMQVQRSTQSQDVYWLDLLCKIIERQLTSRLRFEGGHIYNVAVSPSFSIEVPNRPVAVRGGVSVSFSCSPGSAKALAEKVLSEMEALQEQGPSEEDIATALQIELRAHEVELQENSWWLQVCSVVCSQRGERLTRRCRVLLV
jgi:hypothetical protein